MHWTALVVGVAGFGGHDDARELLAAGWNVVSLARRAPQDLPRVGHAAADLLDPAALSAALEATSPTARRFATCPRGYGPRLTA